MDEASESQTTDFAIELFLYLLPRRVGNFPEKETEGNLMANLVGKTILLVAPYFQRLLRRRLENDFPHIVESQQHFFTYLAIYCFALYIEGKDILYSVLLMSATILETICYLEEKGHVENISYAPFLWAEIFKFCFWGQFVKFGGWFSLRSLCLAIERKYENLFKDKIPENEINVPDFVLTAYTSESDEEELSHESTELDKIYVLEKVISNRFAYLFDQNLEFEFYGEIPFEVINLKVLQCAVSRLLVQSKGNSQNADSMADVQRNMSTLSLENILNSVSCALQKSKQSLESLGAVSDIVKQAYTNSSLTILPDSKEIMPETLTALPGASAEYTESAIHVLNKPQFVKMSYDMFVSYLGDMKNKHLDVKPEDMSVSKEHQSIDGVDFLQEPTTAETNHRLTFADTNSLQSGRTICTSGAREPEREVDEKLEPFPGAEAATSQKSLQPVQFHSAEGKSQFLNKPRKEQHESSFEPETRDLCPENVTNLTQLNHAARFAYYENVRKLKEKLRSVFSDIMNT